ncbi:hypothetical protein [Actinoalloteichus hymeniacidonis]|uniref:Uncharacterized protein n=1 Tax=Actinoalloteichus hymeniacidonis TaxID=340345 RepID=A0AAC9MX68_9PSEU|nr:hypothetical protein [Actinoalloteichus hymeniacidonis]AOS62923.1 hypothetical protein TL08_10545 [Actinoalloteichus hymeniacidonis]MBB5909044.1 hypothetical protein [Actinoalloteichus hymeniacidonis]
MTENDPGELDRPGIPERSDTGEQSDRAARSEGKPAQPGIALDLLPSQLVRRRAWSIAAGALIVGAALGGLFGLIGGRTAGLVAGGVIAVPLLLLAWAEARRRTRLAGSVVSVSAFGTRRVDLNELREIDVLVLDQRGMRTVGLLMQGQGKTVNLSLALYAGAGGRELGILELRRLADALAAVGDMRTLTLSQLLVAQLRAEARGEAAADRPLYKLASVAPAGRLPSRLSSEAVARFVSTLD